MTTAARLVAAVFAVVAAAAFLRVTYLVTGKD
jgi:hypothetical protein